jgi:hypothetical protein
LKPQQLQGPCDSHDNHNSTNTSTSNCTPDTITDSSSNCTTKDSGFVYVPNDKDFATDSSNHVTDSGTNNHYHVFSPGGDKFNDKAGGTSTTSTRDDNNSIGSNSSSRLSVRTAHGFGNYSIIYDPGGDAVDLTLDICKSTDEGSDWCTGSEHLAGAATWHSHHWCTQRYNMNASSLSSLPESLSCLMVCRQLCWHGSQ